jgi:EmrB/QacA subfamily drug resistance transporter
MDNPTPEGELTMTNTQTRAAGNDVDVPSVSAERSHWTLVAVALATFMTYLDNNIVNVAMPVIERDLHLTTSGLEWVVSSYILVFASLLLAGGRLADVWGRKRLFVIGLSVFTVASLAAGMAGNVDVLVISRAMQGLGAAMVTPTTLAIISTTFANPRQRAAAVGIWSGVGALALAVGPLLGGVLSQYLSWGWIFFVNVPVGLATLALGAAAIRESRESAGPRRLDLPGVITSAGALFALTFALIEGHDRGWTSTVILACFALAAVLGVIFVRVELRVDQPMVSMTLFRERVFSGGLIALMMWGFGMFGIYFFTSLYLQGVLGFSPTEAGAAFVPMALLMAAGSVISERVSHRLGAYRVVSVAMLLMAAGVASVSLLGADADILSLMPSFAVIGIGGGMTVPLTASVLDAMPREESGVASGIFNASREVSGLLGITVIGAVLTARQSVLLATGESPVDAFLGGYRAGLLLAAALVALGGVAAYFGLRRRIVGRHAYTKAVAAKTFSVRGETADATPPVLPA